MVKTIKDQAASIRQRLLNLSRSDGIVFQVVLINFGLERLIYRLSVSQYRDQFVLKGGMLVTFWTQDPNRVTRDADFLGYGDPDMDHLKSLFTEIMNIESEDGLKYDTANLTAEAIKEDQEYAGVRLRTIAYLGTTQIHVTIDIGFGDAVTDNNYEIDFPSLLDFPTSTIRAYSPATVVAEKFQAMVVLGLANSRMKDYYDLWAMNEVTLIEPNELDLAIRATFERRNTKIPKETPVGLSEEFINDQQKSQQWTAYIESVGSEDLKLQTVVDSIWSYLGPACVRLTRTE